MTLISVIIPTYRDSYRLKKCLEGISRQKGEDLSFEVIVVNNDPEDQIEAFVGFDFPLILVNEKMPGSYSARNRGIEDATGSYFLFTDSDCIPSEDWIENAQSAIGTNKPDLLAGKVKVFSTSGSWYGEFDEVFAFPNEDYVKKEGFGVTANLLVKKEVIKKVGGFKKGALTGGDSEFCNRAKRAGFKISYDEKMMVYHPARETWDEMKVKAKRFGGRLPKDKNQFIAFVKVLGKFCLRPQDFNLVNRVQKPISDKAVFLLIIARLRFVEALESLRVFFGKQPERL